MLFVMITLICTSYIPTASIPLKGIGSGCFPFFLEPQTAFLTYPATVDNDIIQDYVGVGKYAINADPSHIRFAITKPGSSMLTFDLRTYERLSDGYLHVQLKHAIGIHKFGIMYGVEYNNSNIDTAYDWRDIFLVMKVNFESIRNLLLNVGIMGGKFWYTEYGLEYIPGYLWGPIVELRYDLSPFSFYLSSRHPEDMRETFSLPLYPQDYPGYDYHLFPFEGGFGYARKIDATKLLVLGLRSRFLHEMYVNDTLTVDVTTLGAAFVCGFEIEVMRYLDFRGGFEINYERNITNSTLATLDFTSTMGAAIRFGKSFELHITTKNLAKPLSSEAIVRWYF